MKNFTFLLLVALALLSITSAIRWTHTNKDGQTFIRVIKIVRSPPTNPNTFEVRGVKKEVGTRNVDAVDFLFSTTVVPRFVLRYFSKDADSKEHILNRWALWKVFEYNETDGKPGFDPAAEDILSHYRLFNRRFTTMSYHKDTDADGNTLHYVCTRMDPVDKATVAYPDVELCAHVAEKETRANRTRIHPNSLKWSVTISNYPYTAADSRLGLKVSFDSRDVVRDLSQTDASDEDSQNEAALDLTSDSGDASSRGIAAWVTNVTVTPAGTCSPNADVSEAWSMMPSCPRMWTPSLTIPIPYLLMSPSECRTSPSPRTANRTALPGIPNWELLLETMTRALRSAWLPANSCWLSWLSSLFCGKCIFNKEGFFLRR